MPSKEEAKQIQSGLSDEDEAKNRILNVLEAMKHVGEFSKTNAV